MALVGGGVLRGRVVGGDSYGDALELESPVFGTLLTLAGLFGVRAGCICVVSDRTPWPGPAAIDLDRNMGECIEVATHAMRGLV